MPLSAEQLQTVEAAAARAAAKALSSPEVAELVATTVRQTLIQLGIDTANPLEMQADFRHLREWREANRELKHKGMMALIGIVLSGAAALILLGVKQWARTAS